MQPMPALLALVQFSILAQQGDCSPMLQMGYACVSAVMDGLWGDHGRHAARQQLARNGLVPSLPAGGEQAQAPQPAEALQLSPAAAALQADLAAFLPDVSPDDLLQSALMLRLAAAVQMIEQLPPERHAMLRHAAFTDCQLLLNQLASSGGSLLVARHAVRLTLCTLHDRQPAAQEDALSRLDQLLLHAQERSEADKRKCSLPWTLARLGQHRQHAVQVMLRCAVLCCAVLCCAVRGRLPAALPAALPVLQAGLPQRTWQLTGPSSCSNCWSCATSMMTSAAGGLGCPGSRSSRASSCSATPAAWMHESSPGRQPLACVR